MRVMILGRRGMPTQCPCPELRARGVEILAIAASQSVADQYEAAVIRAVILPFGSRLKWGLYQGLAKAVQEFRPDILHIFENRDVPACLWATRGRPEIR